MNTAQNKTLLAAFAALSVPLVRYTGVPEAPVAVVASVSAPVADEAVFTDIAAEFGTIEAAETPVEMAVQHPKTKKDSGVYITLVGKDSDAYRALSRKLNNKRFGELKKTKTLTMTAEQNEEENLRLLSACVRSWRSRVFERRGEKLVATDNFQPIFFAAEKGKMECNILNVKWVFENVPEIREQVEDFIQDRTNFLTGSSQP